MCPKPSLTRSVFVPGWSTPAGGAEELPTDRQGKARADHDQQPRAGTPAQMDSVTAGQLGLPDVTGILTGLLGSLGLGLPSL